MRILTDEDVASSVARELRKRGFDVKDVKEEKLQGSSDKKLIDLANKEERIIVTHDKDFGNILKFPSVKHKGIILVRGQNQRPENAIFLLLKVLDSELKEKCKNSLVIISEKQITIHGSN